MSPHANADSLRAWLTVLGLQQHADALVEVRTYYVSPHVAVRQVPGEGRLLACARDALDRLE